MSQSATDGSASNGGNADRFTGLAEIYAAHRPTYPAGIMAALGERAGGVDGPRTAIDVGCGTGIATLDLARNLPDWRIVAVEPNADMLAKAKVTCAGQANIVFCEGSAEALPAEAECASLVLAAQALHWFATPAFFAEAARVLVPGGRLAVLYNNRQNAVSAVLSEIETYFESIEDTYSRDYRARDIPALLEGLDAFEAVERVREVWLKPISCDDLVNYFMSRSMMQPLAKKVGLPKLRQRIGDIASEHARSGMIDMPFATELDLATRKAAP